MCDAAKNSSCSSIARSLSNRSRRVAARIKRINRNENQACPRPDQNENVTLQPIRYGFKRRMAITIPAKRGRLGRVDIDDARTNPDVIHAGAPIQTDTLHNPLIYISVSNRVAIPERLPLRDPKKAYKQCGIVVQTCQFRTRKRRQLDMAVKERARALMRSAVRGVLQTNDIGKYIRLHRLALNKKLYRRKFTLAELRDVLVRLGFARGRVVWVQSSWNEFYNFGAKPSELIAVMREILGPGGRLSCPHFPSIRTPTKFSRSILRRPRLGSSPSCFAATQTWSAAFTCHPPSAPPAPLRTFLFGITTMISSPGGRKRLMPSLGSGCFASGSGNQSGSQLFHAASYRRVPALRRNSIFPARL